MTMAAGGANVYCLAQSPCTMCHPVPLLPPMLISLQTYAGNCAIVYQINIPAGCSCQNMVPTGPPDPQLFFTAYGTDQCINCGGGGMANNGCHSLKRFFVFDLINTMKQGIRLLGCAMPLMTW